jgi:hypothetical protein
MRNEGLMSMAVVQNMLGTLVVVRDYTDSTFKNWKAEFNYVLVIN